LEDSALTRQLILGVGGLLIAPWAVLLGYVFLRDSELEPYSGRSLVTRVAICSVIYSALWGVYLYLTRMLGFQASPELPHLVYLIPLLIVPGALTALATLDFEPLLAAVHYCFYLGACVVLRLIMGLGPF
jgi:hypothetical protein